MGDQFRPVITAYGSLSSRKNKVLVPLIPQCSLDYQELTLESDPIELTGCESSNASRKSEAGLSTRRKKSVEALDDDIITLSPDFVPFTLPEEISQKSEDQVLEVVTLDDPTDKILNSKNQKSHPEIIALDQEEIKNQNIEPEIIPLDIEEIQYSEPKVISLDQQTQPEVLEVKAVLKQADPLEIVITLEDSDSSPSVIMDIPAGHLSHPIDDLMEQVRKLIEKIEQNTKGKAKVIAKVNFRLEQADQTYVRSEEFERLVRRCVEEVKSDESVLYPELKKILDKLKASAEKTVASSELSEPVPGTSSSNVAATSTGSSEPLEQVPSTSASGSSCNVAGTSGSSLPGTSDTSSSPAQRKVIKPIRLDTAELKHYDKQNHVKALQLFEQLISIVEDKVPDKVLSTSLVEKLRARLEKAEKKYLYSHVFIKTLVFSINGMLQDFSKIYGYIRKVSDELKANMKCADGEEQSQDDPDEGLDEKTRFKIRKLEKSLKQINKIIAKLETQEIEWNSDEDEENSAYIREDKYQKRYVQIYKKICELRKRRFRIGRPTNAKISFTGTDYPEVNRTIEKFYNSTREFPDYGDMLSLVQKVSDRKSLRLSAAAVQLEAEKAFTSLGEILKQRRLEDDYDIFLSRLGTEEDPAEQDQYLARKLEDNRKHWKKIDEVINEFVIRQEERKKSGEAEEEEDEGGDKEEDDDEDNDEEQKEKDESNDRDSESDRDSEESDDYKENNQGSSDEDESEKSQKKPKCSDEKSNKVNRKNVVDNLMAQFNMSPCEVQLEDCVELYHSSPDKEASFFKYLKLAKLDGEIDTQESLDEDTRDDQMDVDLDEVCTEEMGNQKETMEEKLSEDGESKVSEVKSKPKSRRVSNDTKRTSSEYSTERSIQKSSKKPDDSRKTLDFDRELSQKDNDEDEDQNSVVTSTTDAEPGDKHVSEDTSEVIENKGTTQCEETLADKSSDSIPCVTSSVDNNKTADDDGKTEDSSRSFKDGTTLAEDCEIENIANCSVNKIDCPVDDCTTEKSSKSSEDSSTKTLAKDVETIRKSDSSVNKELRSEDKVHRDDKLNGDSITRDASNTCEAGIDDENEEVDCSPDTVEDTNNSTGDNEIPCVADFIDKENLKLQLADGEDVDQIFAYLSHCQVEVVPADVSTFFESSRDVSDDDEETAGKEVASLTETDENTVETNERKDQIEEKSDRERKTDKPSEDKTRDKTKAKRRTSSGSESSKRDHGEEDTKEKNRKKPEGNKTENKKKTAKRRLSSESEATSDSDDSDDEEACGIPARFKAKIAKMTNKPKAEVNTNATSKSSSKRKRDSSSSEEEEEEDEEVVEGKSDDSSDEDFNPYEEARAIRSMREQSGKKTKNKRRKLQQKATSSSQYKTASSSQYGAASSSQMYNRSAPNANSSYPAGARPSKPAQSKVNPTARNIPNLPGITLTPLVAPTNPLPNINLKNVTISRSGENPSSTTQGFRPRPPMGPRPNLGPASSKFGPRPMGSNIGPASSKFGPRPMGSRTNVGPASSKFGPRPMGSNIGPASSKFGPRPMGSNIGPASFKFGPRPMGSGIGPASSKFGPRQMGSCMGPASERSRMGPTTAIYRSNAPPPRNISESNMNKTLIKGGVQVQWNKLQASQEGNVSNLQRETNISSKQRVAGSVHSQKIQMKHSVSKDADSGAGQESRVTSNVQRTVTKDGRQIIRKVKKTVTTNVEVEEIMIDAGEVIDID